MISPPFCASYLEWVVLWRDLIDVEGSNERHLRKNVILDSWDAVEEDNGCDACKNTETGCDGSAKENVSHCPLSRLFCLFADGRKALSVDNVQSHCLCGIEAEDVALDLVSSLQISPMPTQSAEGAGWILLGAVFAAKGLISDRLAPWVNARLAWLGQASTAWVARQVLRRKVSPRRGESAVVDAPVDSEWDAW